ncbi:unnamed protein product, partial [Rotaria magnacalcarata]
MWRHVGQRPGCVEFNSASGGATVTHLIDSYRAERIETMSSPGTHEKCS